MIFVSLLIMTCVSHFCAFLAFLLCLLSEFHLHACSKLVAGASTLVKRLHRHGSADQPALHGLGNSRSASDCFQGVRLRIADKDSN